MTTKKLLCLPTC